MSRRVLVHLGVALAVTVVADTVLVLRGGDLVLASVVVLSAVTVSGLLLESSTGPSTTWLHVTAEKPAEIAADPGLAALRRLVSGHQSARIPDKRLQQRLARLAEARGRPGDDEMLDRLKDESRPIRFTPAQLSQIIDRIEQL